MGDEDKCANCNKKIFSCVLTAKDFKNNDAFYFCSNICFNKFNIWINNKLEWISRICGGYWA